MLVTPVPGAHRDNVLKTLRSVHMAAANLNGGVQENAYGRLLSYLVWANDSVRLLTSQIHVRDIDRLVRTRTHQSLLDGVGHLAGSSQQKLLNGLVSLEIEQRTAALEDALNSLQDQMARWSSGISLLVPDTSFYIKHPTKLLDVDFAALTGITGPVRVLFPMVVVDELDRLKETRDKHVRWRAGYTLAILDKLLDDGTDGPHEVEVQFDPPGHTRLPIPDDEIIDRALAARAIAAGPVQLVTYDTGQAMRAKAADMPVLKLRTDAGTGEEPAR
jgi:rRNA-processing protein FCF1